LVLRVPLTVQSEMTAAIAVLALSEELKPHLLNLGACKTSSLLRSELAARLRSVDIAWHWISSLSVEPRSTVQSEMTAAIAVLALSEELKPHLLNLGVFDVLIDDNRAQKDRDS
jgi:hypothetical protein